MGKGSGKKKGSGGNEEVKNEHPLQAVLLADSFTEELRPVTLQVSALRCIEFVEMKSLAWLRNPKCCFQWPEESRCLSIP